MNYELSLIFRTKMNGLGRHYGVLLPGDKVLDVHKTISVVSLSEFTQNGLLPITNEVTRLVSELDLKVRLSTLKNFIYCLFNQNCEHVSRLLVEGKPECKQIEKFVESLITILKALLLVVGVMLAIIMLVEFFKSTKTNDQAA